MDNKQTLDAKIKLVHLEEDAVERSWDHSKPYLEYRCAMVDIWRRRDELYREKRLVSDYKLEEIPEYGVVYTLGQFRSLAKARFKIDCYGVGFYGTDRMESDVAILVDDILHKKVRNDFTHVIWYE